MYNTTFYIRFWNESVKELSETEKDEWEKLCKKITDYNFSNLKIAFGLKSNWRQCVENYKSWGGGMYMQEVNEVMNPWYKIFLTPKYYADKYTEERLKKLVGTKDLVIGDYINKDLISKYGS